MASKIDESCRLVAGQRKYGGILVEADVVLTELLVEALHVAAGGVVVLAQMTQHDVLDARVVNLRQEPRRFSVAQMAERPSNALFQDIGIRAVLQHLNVIIGLDDQVFGPTDLLLHHLVEHPYIGGDGQRMTFILKMITHRPATIVHHGKRLNPDTQQLKRLHRLNLVEERGIHVFRAFPFNEALQAVRMGVNRYGTAFCEVLQAQHMVDMIVSDKNGLDVFERKVLFPQFFFHLLGTDTHVDEQTFILPAHIVAIAATARGKATKNEGRKARKEVHP